MPDPETTPVVDLCRHCGQRVVLVEYIRGVKWMHEPADIAGQIDAMHVYCKLSVAESSVMGEEEGRG